MPGEGTLRLRSEGDRFVAEVCQPPRPCEVVGEPNGYTKEQLKMWLVYHDSTTEALPLFASVGVVAALVVLGGVLPIAVTAVAMLGAIGSLVFGFSHSPQTQAGLRNDIAAEILARPGALRALEANLREMDTGSPVTKDPRILSEGRPAKSSPVPAAPAAAPTSTVPVAPEDSFSPAI